MLELSSFKGRDPLWDAGLCRHHLGILVSITDWFICQLGMDSPLEGKLLFFIEKGEVGVSSSFPDLLPRGSWKSSGPRHCFYAVGYKTDFLTIAAVSLVQGNISGVGFGYRISENSAEPCGRWGPGSGWFETSAQNSSG